MESKARATSRLIGLCLLLFFIAEFLEHAEAETSVHDKIY